MTQGAIVSRFDFDVLCAGVIKMVMTPKYLDKFGEHIDPDFFFIGDKSLRIEAFRKILKLLIEIRSAGQINFLTVEFFSAKIRQAVPSEVNDEARVLFPWMISDEGVRKMAADEGCFSIFTDYLKVIQILKWAKPFESAYKQGDINKAIETVRDLIPNVDRIKMDEDYKFSVDDIDKLLPDSNNQYSDVLYLGCDWIDSQTGGFEKQTLNGFISPTNGGKSMMTQHIIRQCIRQKIYAHVTCVEERPKSFTRRIIASVTGIPIKRLRNQYHELSSDELRLIAGAKEYIQKYIKIEFVYGESIDSIHRRKLEYDAERRAKGLPVAVVDVVDYSAHVAHLSHGDKSYQQIHRTYASRKDFCLKHDKIGIDFAQINREGDHKVQDDALITQADLAGSYDLAQVFDTLFSINRSSKEKDAQQARLHACKGRDAETGSTVLVETDFARARWNMNGANTKLLNNTTRHSPVEHTINNAPSDIL